MNLKPLPLQMHTLILSEDEFSLLHQITMSYPEGIADLSILDVRVNEVLGALRSYGFIQQKGYRWLPTEAGVAHIMPKRRLAS